MGRLFIEAGHNFNDPGAIGFDGRKEADWTIRCKELLAEAVRQQAPEIDVILDDDRMSLSQTISDFRSKITNDDLLVSIHFNSASVSAATGTEVFVSDNASERSKRIGYDTAHMLSQTLGIKNRGLKKESQSARKKLGILQLKGAAILIEVSFINNPRDMEETEKWLHWGLWELATIYVAELKGKV